MSFTTYGRHCQLHLSEPVTLCAANGVYKVVNRNKDDRLSSMLALCSRKKR
jgi:hypothetical protein